MINRQFYLLIFGIATLFVVLCNSHDVQSQIIDYKFNHINFDDGLSNLNVDCFAKDELGFIWVGTEDGLNRFDGKNLKVYRHIKGDDNCISNNNINALVATANYLWVGSEGFGIDRYNLETDEFENFHLKDKNGNLYPQNVNSIVELTNRNILVGADDGLYIFDVKSEVLKPFFVGKARDFFSTLTVLHIFEDEDKTIWLGTENDIFRVYPDDKSYLHVQEPISVEYDNHWTQHISKGPDNNFYVLKQNYLFVLSPDFKQVIFKKEFEKYVGGCVFDIYGRLWIVGDGLYVFDNQQFSQLNHDPLNPYSISDKLTKSIFVDNQGIIWIGTWNNGMSYFHPDDQRHRIKNLIKRSDGKGLPENPVDFTFEDHLNRIWIGTNWGGITIYDPKNGDMEYWSNSNNSDLKISANLNYTSFFKDGKIWIGTFRKGLDCYDIKNHKVYNYPIPRIIGQMPKINKVAIDSVDTDNLLLCTENGLVKYNTVSGQAHFFDPKEYNLPNEEFLDLCYLNKNQVIIVVDQVGLYLFNIEQNTFKPYLTKKISSNILSTITTDKKNNLLLIGANNGLNVVDLFSNKVHIFARDAGFQNENITGIIKDNRGYYWLTTTNGICFIELFRTSGGNIEIHRMRNLDSSDGLVGNQCRERSSILTEDGNILLGTNNGLSIFDPEIFSFQVELPEIMLSDIKVFNQSVKVTPESDDAILNKSIFYTQKIDLSHKENSVSFDFTVLDFFKKENNRYKYKLEGFDKDWISTTLGSAVYTNLNPGNYTFKVVEDSSTLPNNRNGIELAISITPPFYKTKQFIFSLIAFLSVIIFTFYFLRLRFYKKRHIYLESVVNKRTNDLKLANENLLERNNEISLMAKKVHDADEMKLRFFSNVHHEFRTALSLIIGPIEELKKNKSIIKSIGNDVKIISSNAKRLLGLVNEILDYRKIDAGKLGLNLIYADAIVFLKDIKSLFDCKAKEMGIDYLFHCDSNSAFIHFDSQKVEHIIFNLLSNAFKYTEAKGKIEIRVSLRNLHNELKNKESQTKPTFQFSPLKIKNSPSKFLEVSVIDNGIGFKDEEHIKLIWERFYRMPNKQLASNVGSGIGLALTKELAQIHHGLVSAEPNSMGGASFNVWLPMDKTWFAEIENVNILDGELPSATRTADVDDKELVVKKKNSSVRKNKNPLPLVLVIEDNLDIHFFLNNHLPEYTLRFKDNGKEGIETAKELVPDLIICDIMLPDIHGYHIVKELKNNVATSHIPIIMLTALVGEENIIKALNIGADDYVTKPFTINTLKARINNLLSIREKLREFYSSNSEIKPEEVSKNPVDQKFYKRLTEIILDNVENYDLSVTTLAELMGMSRIQLYRKVNSITKKGPADMIRKIRLKYSKSLLKKSNLAVADVAVRIGYSESSSFIRAFTQEYGVSPLNYVKKYYSESPSEAI